MTLTPARMRAYLCGALTGAFAALSVVAVRQGRKPVALVAAVISAICGTLAVTYEERAQQ